MTAGTRRENNDSLLLRERARPADTRLTTRLRTWLLRHAQVFFGSLGRLARTPVATLMTAAVIGIALALPTGLHLVLQNLQQLSGGWEGAAQISLFLRADTTENEAQALLTRLRKMPEVGRADYISREAALAEFTRLSGFGDALSALDENPLPSVIVVTPTLKHTSPAASEQLLVRLRDLPDVDLAQLDMQWIQRLYAIMAIVERTIEVLGLLLALGVILVVGNPIRLAIQNRRDEIVIIKLIGGTDTFIRRPFLYSGFWYGLLGGILGIVLITLAVLALDGPIRELAGLYQSTFSLRGLDAASVGLLLGGSVLLGLVGSWLAVGRHLRAIEPR